jgi:hypothetical protein
MENPREVVTVMQKTQSGINFFTENPDYQKAEIYRSRFEFLRATALDKLNIMVLKTIRECNAQNNMRVVQTGVFDKERTSNELDELQSEVQQVIFTPHRNPPD